MILKAISGVVMLFPRSIAAQKGIIGVGATTLGVVCICSAAGSSQFDLHTTYKVICIACMVVVAIAFGMWSILPRAAAAFTKGDRVVLRHGPARQPGTVLQAGPGGVMVEWDGDLVFSRDTYFPDLLRHSGVRTQHAALTELDEETKQAVTAAG